jgi:2-amino-4-hydroxy-6-hydroxymethyldihydropteridine diphosphokinase
MHRAFIGLGANLGQPVSQIRDAFKGLRAHPGITVLRESSLYSSAPVDAPGQPDFVNAVAMIDSPLEPLALLQALHELEAQSGRVRSFQNAPRTLDLDLLLYDNCVLAFPDLRVPHPRMHLRRFVLDPLVEIAPAAEIPGLGSAARLLDGLGDQAVERLPAP